MQLRELLSKIQLTCPMKDDIHLVTIDSRKTGPGVVYVACKGALSGSKDGHTFIPEVIANGVSALIIENPAFLRTYSVPTFLVPDSRIAVAKLAEALYQNPSSALEIYGVTGTNGKTTVTFLTAAIAEEFQKKNAVLGTLGYGHKDHLNYFGMTTPEAETLSSILSELKKENFTHVAMEVSSHALALHRVDGISFKAAAFTNLSVDHLDFHGNLEEYRKAKERFFLDLLPASSPAILPKNNPLTAELQERNHIVYTWGEEPDCMIRAESVSCSTEGLQFTLCIQDQKHEVRSSLLGHFNIDNMLCAAGLGKAMGAPLEVIAKGLSNASAPKGRLERVLSSSPHSPTVLVDFAHTPDALKQTLETLLAVPHARLIVVFGCGGDRDKTKRPQMGQIVASLADVAIVTSDNPRHENPGDILKEIEKGIPPSSRYQMIENREEAIYEAIQLANSEDIVLIAGKGHETYQEIGDEKRPFNDADIAKSVLEDLSK